MIDIHCHILSCIDDGPKNRERSLKMARDAVAEGITAIIATPHQWRRGEENTKSKIMKRVTVLNQDLEEAQIPLKIHPGQEARISRDMVERYENDNVMSLNDAHQFMHVEVLSGKVPHYIKDLLREIRQKGLVPILVHPERNRDFFEAPERLYELVQEGALTQITASSVTGHFGERIEAFSKALMEHHLVHFVASDAHDLPSRIFRMKEAFADIEREFSADYSAMLRDNASLLLEGKDVVTEAPVFPNIKKPVIEEPSMFT